MPRKKKAPRKLLNGDYVPNDNKIHKLSIETSCPAKWLFVDMETGTVWHKTKESESWLNVGYVDVAAPTSMVILPAAAGGIPRFKFWRGG